MSADQPGALPAAVRRRAWLVLAVLLTIGLGLSSRHGNGWTPAFLGKYPGDALWAQMVYWLCAWVMPAASVLKLSLNALAFSFAVEFSQLYQAPWINQIRATTLGHLVLGSRFLWQDLLAYALGIGAVALFDAALLRWQRVRSAG